MISRMTYTINSWAAIWRTRRYFGFSHLRCHLFIKRCKPFTCETFIFFLKTICQSTISYLFKIGWRTKIRTFLLNRNTRSAIRIQLKFGNISEVLWSMSFYWNFRKQRINILITCFSPSSSSPLIFIFVCVCWRWERRNWQEMSKLKRHFEKKNWTLLFFLKKKELFYSKLRAYPGRF